MTAVIMAGGKGTRMQQVHTDIPKPMIPVLGRPVLEYQIESLKKSGIVQIFIITGYLKDVIIRYFGNGSRFGVQVHYIEEEQPLGTAGALFYLRDKIKDDFLLLFGDLMLDVDFVRFVKFHRQHNGCVTLCAHPNTHPFDSDLIAADESGCVRQILLKDRQRDFLYHNFTNAGLYCMSPEVFQCVPVPAKRDLEKDVLIPLIEQSAVYAYKTTEYIRDMGTPDRLRKTEEDAGNGIITNKNLRNSQKIIFLDSSVILKNRTEVLPGTANAVKRINASEYLAAAVVNLEGIYADEKFIEIQKIIETELGNQGAYLDMFLKCYYGSEMNFRSIKTEKKDFQNFDEMLACVRTFYHIEAASAWYVQQAGTKLRTCYQNGTECVWSDSGAYRNTYDFPYAVKTILSR
ncbi:MAG: NTP transferase domain-containing protein [Eubacterium sp.]|nr:NTP transferase domain-containing protein [Eubacterium sp.]